MNHRGPNLPNDICDKIDNLEKEYTSYNRWGSKNPKRIQLIKLIKSFSISTDEKYNHKAAVGICTYGLISIDSSCSMFQKPKKQTHYKLFGSQLGSLLQDSLKISYANPLDDQSALIYLAELCKHLKKYPRDTSGKRIKEMQADELIADIAKQAQVILLRISKKRPTYNALMINFSNIAERYNEISGQTSRRDQYVQFFKILNTELNNEYKNDEQKESSDNYSIRYAAIIYMMDKIESEYNYLYPGGSKINSGSALYKSCQEAINLDCDTTKIPKELKRKYYVGLLYHILKIKQDYRRVEQWEKMGLRDAKGFFNKFSAHLAQRVADIFKETNPNNIPMSYLGLVSAAAASHGVSIALGKIATEAHLRGKGLAAFNLVRPEAALLITILTYAANAYVMKKATGAANKIIIDYTTYPVIITFSTMQKLGQFCLAFVLSETNTRTRDLTDSKEFIYALDSLPKDAFTKEINDKLKLVLDYKDKDKPIGLTPLKPLTC